MADIKLTKEERQIIELIGEGMARYGIAARMGLSVDRVRTVVRRLCERFDCPMVQLPGKVGIFSVQEIVDDIEDDGTINV